MSKLTPVDIRQAWDKVRPGLEEIHSGQDCEWRPEDVYAFCTTGRASLYLAESDEGFAVLRKHANTFTGEVTIFIWAVWGEGDRILERYWPELERIAKGEGASVLKFESKRPGFSRLEGWEVGFTTYERRIA